MPDQSDRDILIEVRTKVLGLHTELLGGDGREGRLPKVERVVEDHAERINTATGSVRAIVWIISGIGILLVTLTGVVVAHVLGGK